MDFCFSKLFITNIKGIFSKFYRAGKEVFINLVSKNKKKCI
jgi:hypothetical protein